MKYKVYFADNYSSIKRMMDDIKDRPFQVWDDYDLEGDTEYITLEHEDDCMNMENPRSWRIIFGNSREKNYRHHDRCIFNVMFWHYYIFFFENGKRVLIETESENILKELYDLLQKQTDSMELILNDDDAFVV